MTLDPRAKRPLKANLPERPRVLAVLDRRLTACETYRVIWPLAEVEKAGWEVWLATADTVARRLKRGTDDFAKADLLLFNRLTVARDGSQDQAFIDEIARTHARGAAIGVDYDDDMSGEYREVAKGTKLPPLSGYDFLTVSTDRLAKQMAGRNKRTYVLPNGISPKLYRDPQGQPWPRVMPYPTIGLSGSITHRKDWGPAVQALVELLSEREDFSVLVSGFVPEGMEGLLGKGRVKTTYDVAPTGYPITQDGMRLAISHYGFLKLNADLELAPVDPDDLFNHSKSEIKVTEGFCALRTLPGGGQGGAAAIATGGKLEIYKVALNRGGGLLVNQHRNVAEWKFCIEWALKNLEVCQRIAAQEGENFRVERFTQERMNVYRRHMALARRRVV